MPSFAISVYKRDYAFPGVFPPQFEFTSPRSCSNVSVSLKMLAFFVAGRGADTRGALRGGAEAAAATLNKPLAFLMRTSSSSAHSFDRGVFQPFWWNASALVKMAPRLAAFGVIGGRSCAFFLRIQIIWGFGDEGALGVVRYEPHFAESQTSYLNAS